MSINSPFERAPENARRPLVVRDSLPIPAVFLTSPVRQPSVFRKRIKRVDPGTKTGDLVAVYADFQREDALVPELLGYGIYNKKSEISLRMLRFGSDLPDHQFWEARIRDAFDLRCNLLKIPASSDAFRLIHAESDGFPGVVADLYGDVLSVEIFSWGMYLRSADVVEKMLRATGARHFLVRCAPHLLAQEGFQGADYQSRDLPEFTLIREEGTEFRVSFDQSSHKTGFFCDQRENRIRLAGMCAGKSVLDLCCYTGGFAVQAKNLGRARDVTGVDLDEKPLEIARHNALQNRCQIRFVTADIFPFMRDMMRNQKQFDVVVLDPPKLIRSRQEYEAGKRAHYDMNRLAMRLVRPGGIFLTCTCAGLLSRNDFQELVIAASRGSRPGPTEGDRVQQALQQDVRMKLLARTGAAADHPVGINCLETEYLNALWFQVCGD